MCDTLCAGGGGRMLFAKNSDRPIGEAQVVEGYRRRPAGGELRTQYLTIPDHGAFALIGSRPTWLWGFEHGINEHAVAIGNERVWTVDDPSRAPDALIGMDLVRLGLELGATAVAAIDSMTDLLERYGQGGIADATLAEAYFSSFLVCDPNEAWILETSGRTWAARRSDGGVAISNRLVLNDDWIKASSGVVGSFQRWADPSMPVGHADVRLAVTTPFAAEPNADARSAAAVLRHHGGHPWGRIGQTIGPDGIDPLPGPDADFDGTGVSVCMHLRGFETTAASMIAELDSSEVIRAWAALGSPCVSAYVPVFIDRDGPAVPPVLGAPATWTRFDLLRAKVERIRDQHGARASQLELARIRSELGQLEATLWDESDRAHAIGADPRQKLLESSSMHVERALERLELA
ncbi:MAG: C69 family dipeptidase [Acidimicrobiales bacterium]|nr:C69 family dipeptidase [Acidimicrobiales bacterium]